MLGELVELGRRKLPGHRQGKERPQPRKKLRGLALADHVVLLGNPPVTLADRSNPYGRKRHPGPVVERVGILHPERAGHVLVEPVFEHAVVAVRVLRGVHLFAPAGREDKLLAGFLFHQEGLRGVVVFVNGQVFETFHHGVPVSLIRPRDTRLLAGGRQFGPVKLLQHLQLNEARVTLRNAARLVLIVLRVPVDDLACRNSDKRQTAGGPHIGVARDRVEIVGNRPARSGVHLHAAMHNVAIGQAVHIVGVVAVVGANDAPGDAVGVSRGAHNANEVFPVPLPGLCVQAVNLRVRLAPANIAPGQAGFGVAVIAEAPPVPFDEPGCRFVGAVIRRTGKTIVRRAFQAEPFAHDVNGAQVKPPLERRGVLGHLAGPGAQGFKVCRDFGRREADVGTPPGKQSVGLRGLETTHGDAAHRAPPLAFQPWPLDHVNLVRMMRFGRLLVSRSAMFLA